MAITASALLPRIKRELRVTNTLDDTRLTDMIKEAVEQLQLFKAKTLVDTVADADTETTLSELDLRYIAIYCAMYFEGDTALQLALDRVAQLVRTQ